MKTIRSRVESTTQPPGELPQKAAPRRAASNPKMPAGRPTEPNSAGITAPQLTVRLDLHSEAAVAALRAAWATREDGPPAAAAALKRALVETAARVCPEATARAVAVIRARRAAE